MASERIGGDADWTPDEMMTTVAARELKDGEVCFVGIGLPNLACNLALATHAPGLVLVYESGTVGSAPERLPVSIGDPSLAAGALMVVGIPEIFQHFLQAGRVDVGFLGGAQIDRYGNINSTVIGEYDHPKVRLPGSGGAAEIAAHARRTLVMARLRRRSFPAAVDFVTSSGHRFRGRRRQELSLPGRGPTRVITDQAVLSVDPTEGELILAGLYPGVRREEVADAVGWPLRDAPELETIDPPSPEEIRLLRERLDPEGLYLARPASPGTDPDTRRPRG
jgi:glutaconate CoA-transferase, subunit B